MPQSSLKKLKIGAAERWFTLGMALLISLLYILINIEDFFKADYTQLSTWLPVLIRKLFIIALIVFSLSFSFRQFLINKHLFTLNRHRETTLNSFRLFIETIDKDDISIRNALMLEVAKSIYEQGKTGYLSEKGKETTRPSIVELHKLIQNKEFGSASD